MRKGGNPDLKHHEFKPKAEPRPRQVNFRVTEEMFDFIRSLPDSGEFIRQAIAEKRERMLNDKDISEDEFLTTPVEESNVPL